MDRYSKDPSRVKAAIECVEAYINTGVKSMYFMDAWMEILYFIEEELKNGKKN